LILEEGRMIVDSDNKRVIDELRKHRVEAIPLAFDGPIRWAAAYAALTIRSGARAC